jgi:CheY-like chemotaxis protein
MYQNIIIVVLLFIIIGMTWVWYVKPKPKFKTNSQDRTLESLKLEFDDKYHPFIDEILDYEYAYDTAKVLLEKIQKLMEKEEICEVKIKEYEEVQSKVTKGLDQKSHEIIHISHQMRTSLSGLLGFTHFLKSTNLTKEQDEFVSIISTSSDELLTLVNSIIDMTPRPRSEEKEESTRKNKITTLPKNEIPYVLVVDDNEINKRLLAKVLENENLDVKYASDGKEAFELRKENDFDIIFMDIQMPVMDGVEASKAIRQYEDEQDIVAVPIIALTANTGKDDRDTYLDAGMTDYMAKPIMINEVRKRIAQL